MLPAGDSYSYFSHDIVAIANSWSLEELPSTPPTGSALTPPAAPLELAPTSPPTPPLLTANDRARKLRIEIEERNLPQAELTLKEMMVNRQAPDRISALLLCQLYYDHNQIGRANEFFLQSCLRLVRIRHNIQCLFVEPYPIFLALRPYLEKLRHPLRLTVTFSPMGGGKSNYFQKLVALRALISHHFTRLSVQFDRQQSRKMHINESC
jgi:hypothetical protein